MIDVTEHMGLAHHIANKMYPKYKNKYDLEDFVQVAYVGLVKAGNKFDDSKGFQFSTYAVATISGELIRFVQDDKKFNRVRGVSHNLIMSSYEAERENGSLEQRIGADNFEDTLINMTELNQAIEKLTTKEKQVLKMTYISEISQKEIAKLMKTSQCHISRIKRRVSKKLKSILSDAFCEKVSI